MVTIIVINAEPIIAKEQFLAARLECHNLYNLTPSNFNASLTPN